MDEARDSVRRVGRLSEPIASARSTDLPPTWLNRGPRSPFIAIGVPVLRLGLPLGVSIAVHATILLLMIGVAWQFGGPSRGADLGPPVLITLSPPPAETNPQPATQSEGGRPVLSRAIDPGPPPTLTSSTASSVVPPALRSSLSDGPVPVLRPGALQIGGATFAGLGTKRARSVVYVVDASGAMVTNFKWIKGELERSVAALSPTQKFQVVLFRDLTLTGEGGTTELFSPAQASGDAALLPATGPNKGALASWLNTVYPTGRSNPLDGLKRALELEPDVVFLLSRGIRRTGGREDDPAAAWGPGAEATLAELDRLNPPLREGGPGSPTAVDRGWGPPRMVIIKTIQFLEEDPTGIMRSIAEHHGDGTGSYRVLTLRDLSER